MKALHKTVLPRTARLKVEGLDLIRLEPALHHLGDELRTVVAPQMLRHPGLLHGLLQPGQHLLPPSSPAPPTAHDIPACIHPGSSAASTFRHAPWRPR